MTQGQLSLFTLGGRMRFAVGLSPQEQAIFQTAKVREILLSRPGRARARLNWRSGSSRAMRPRATTKMKRLGLPASPCTYPTT